MTISSPACVPPRPQAGRCGSGWRIVAAAPWPGGRGSRLSAFPVLTSDSVVGSDSGSTAPGRISSGGWQTRQDAGFIVMDLTLSLLTLPLLWGNTSRNDRPLGGYRCPLTIDPEIQISSSK